jgi:hypothetical protein
VVTARGPAATDDDQETDVEFSMLDQAAFAGIDAYVKRHGLNDASLAETRRAKVYGVNLPKDKAAKGGAETAGEGDVAAVVANGEGDEGFEGETELQRAERLLQDEEDDDEEDYVDEGSEEEESSDDEGYEEGGDGDREVFEEEAEYEEEEGGYEEEG